MPGLGLAPAQQPVAGLELLRVDRLRGLLVPLVPGQLPPVEAASTVLSPAKVGGTLQSPKAVAEASDEKADSQLGSFTAVTT